MGKKVPSSTFNLDQGVLKRIGQQERHLISNYLLNNRLKIQTYADAAMLLFRVAQEWEDIGLHDIHKLCQSLPSLLFLRQHGGSTEAPSWVKAERSACLAPSVPPFLLGKKDDSMREGIWSEPAELSYKRIGDVSAPSMAEVVEDVKRIPCRTATTKLHAAHRGVTSRPPFDSHEMIEPGQLHCLTEVAYQAFVAPQSQVQQENHSALSVTSRGITPFLLPQSVKHLDPQFALVMVKEAWLKMDVTGATVRPVPPDDAKTYRANLGKVLHAALRPPAHQHPRPLLLVLDLYSPELVWGEFVTSGARELKYLAETVVGSKHLQNVPVIRLSPSLQERLNKKLSPSQSQQAGGSSSSGCLGSEEKGEEEGGAGGGHCLLAVGLVEHEKKWLVRVHDSNPLGYEGAYYLELAHLQQLCCGVMYGCSRAQVAACSLVEPADLIGEYPTEKASPKRRRVRNRTRSTQPAAVPPAADAAAAQPATPALAQALAAPAFAAASATNVDSTGTGSGAGKASRQRKRKRKRAGGDGDGDGDGDGSADQPPSPASSGARNEHEHAPGGASAKKKRKRKKKKKLPAGAPAVAQQCTMPLGNTSAPGPGERAVNLGSEEDPVWVPVTNIIDTNRGRALKKMMVIVEVVIRYRHRDDAAAVQEERNVPLVSLSRACQAEARALQKKQTKDANFLRLTEGLDMWSVVDAHLCRAAYDVLSGATHMPPPPPPAGRGEQQRGTTPAAWRLEARTDLLPLMARNLRLLDEYGDTQRKQKTVMGEMVRYNVGLLGLRILAILREHLKRSAEWGDRRILKGLMLNGELRVEGQALVTKFVEEDCKLIDTLARNYKQIVYARYCLCAPWARLIREESYAPKVEGERGKHLVPSEKMTSVVQLVKCAYAAIAAIETPSDFAKLGLGGVYEAIKSAGQLARVGSLNFVGQMSHAFCATVVNHVDLDGINVRIVECTCESHPQLPQGFVGLEVRVRFGHTDGLESDQPYAGELLKQMRHLYQLERTRVCITPAGEDLYGRTIADQIVPMGSGSSSSQAPAEREWEREVIGRAVGDGYVYVTPFFCAREELYGVQRQAKAHALQLVASGKLNATTPGQQALKEALTRNLGSVWLWPEADADRKWIKPWLFKDHKTKSIARLRHGNNNQPEAHSQQAGVGPSA
eukprot:jgi/Mesen1/1942/ME000146S01015